jgi:hypothetical protein
MSRDTTKLVISGHVSLSPVDQDLKGNVVHPTGGQHRTAIAALHDGVPIFAVLIWSHRRRHNNRPPKLVKTPHPGLSGRGVVVRS